jgi:hypothetical protein
MAKAMNERDSADTFATVGMAYAFLGDRDQAFRYLEQAYANGDSQLLFAVRLPALDALHSDPRYAELLRKMGLPE